MLTARLVTIFQIRPGEGRLVGLLVALMLLPAIGASVGAPGIEALFFSRFGVEFLPYMYVVLGSVTAVVSLALTALLGRVSRVRLYRTLPPLLASLLLGSRVLVGLDLNWFYPLLWVANSLFAMLQGLLTWGLAGLVCDTRQAKRLFPLFAAGNILGAALGGLITRPLVAWVGTENLLLVWAAVLLGALALVRALTRDIVETRRSSRRRRSRVIDDLQVGFQYARRSALMRWISTAAVLFAVLFFALAFPFSKAAAAQFPDEDALAGFLGLFLGTTTSVALLLSLLLANRLYALFGFMSAILAYAVIYLTGFAALAVYGAFAALVLLRFLQMSWTLGVVDSAFQATFNVVPAERREQTRTFIIGVPMQAGVVLVGLLLAVAQQTLQDQQLYLIGVGTAALATFVMWRAKRAYAGELVAALRAGQPLVFFSEEAPFGGFQHDAAALDVALAGVADPDPAVRRLSAEILGGLVSPEATLALVDALGDPDPEVRVAMLRALAQTDASAALLDVAAHLTDAVPEVRVQAVATLRALAGYPKGLIAHVQPLLADADPAVRSSAAVALLSTAPHPAAVGVLQAMAQAGDVPTRVEALQGFGAWGDGAAYDPAIAGLEDPHPAVRQAAAAALARIDVQRCVDPLVRALGDEDGAVRATIARAIGTLGARALPATLSALSDPTLEAGALLALAELPVHQEAQALRAYARGRVARALDYDELWRGVRRYRVDGDRAGLLADSLRATAHNHGTNALRAIGLSGDRDAISLAIENLGGSNPDQQANALEMLDALGDRDTIRPLLRLWEVQQEAAETAGVALEDWLLRLLKDRDPWLRACAALAAADSAAVADVTSPLAAELGRLAQSDPDALVRETAAVSLKGEVVMETLPTLSLMERILFLRRVPLFADLPPAELKQVAGIAEELLFLDVEIISHQDDPGDEMYIIVSGEVKVEAGAQGNGTTELARRRTGDYVGEMAIISKEPRMASLVAVGDVRTLCISQKPFEGILRQRPETSLAVMRVLCARLREHEAVRETVRP
jgi:HEAT repeat protein